MPPPARPFPPSEESWLRAALNLLFPPRCAACVTRLRAQPEETRPAPGEDPHSSYCQSCVKTLERIEPPFCQICSEPFPGEMHHAFTCPNCAGRGYEFECAVSAWMASGALREAVHRFKYDRQVQLRGVLTQHLRDALDDLRLAGEKGWILVPVPLHRRRRRERTFNQSEELARELAKLTGLAWVDALRRIRYTSTQASLTRKARLENLKGAFRLGRGAEALRGRPVLLIDDVFTTGSTVQECAKILRTAGPSRIAVITAARG